jgi:hypothetical protein
MSVASAPSVLIARLLQPAILKTLISISTIGFLPLRVFCAVEGDGRKDDEPDKSDIWKMMAKKGKEAMVRIDRNESII